MRSLTRTVAVAALAGGLVFSAGGPAVAAQAPDEHAPCLAQVFQAQAVEAPQTVSDRILEIRELYLDGAPFGQVLKPLTRGAC